MSKRIVAVVMVGLLVAALLSADLSAVRAEFGSNWTAEYFDNPNLSGSPVATQIVQAINFNFGTDDPLDNVGLPEDNFSIRFTGTQTFAAGTYEFVVTSDDGVRVFIDGALVLDRFIGRAQTTDRFTQTLTAGAHTIRVEYFEGVDRALIQFQWFPVSTVVTPGPGTPIVSTATGGPSPTPAPTFTPAPLPPTALPPIPPGALVGYILREPVVIARQAPNFTAPELTRVSRGQAYAIVGRTENADWFLLQMSGFQAWVTYLYVYVDGDPHAAPVVSRFILVGNPGAATGVVGQATVNVRLRAAPGEHNEQIGRIDLGDLVAVLGRNGNGEWYQVNDNGAVGWASAHYIRIVEGDANSLPTTG